MKQCQNCNNIKEYKDFPKRKDSPDGYRNTCKQCRLDYQRKWSKGEIKKKDYTTEEGMKTCRSCNKTLSVDNFGKTKKNKDGLKSYCKECKRKESATWRDKNPNYNKKYRDENKEKAIEYSRRYYKENKEDLAAKKKVYAEKNKDEESARKKAWYENNKDRVLSNKKKRYAKNKEEIIIREQLYIVKSPTARLRNALRKRFYQAVKKGYKIGSAVRDLGCSIEDLKIYMEDKFSDGMTWENYGRWHIDHIIPLSSFDLTDYEQVKKACHYTNLQPLWSEDNLKKGSKIPDKK